MKDDTSSRVLRLEIFIDGMLAVHAKQAVYTALAGVEGVRRAEVELGRAELELASPPAAGASVAELGDAARRQLAEAVELAGCEIREIRVLPRSLPTL